MECPEGQLEPFDVENSMDLLLVLLYAPGKAGEAAEPIEGITRLQKLMFLLQQGDVGPRQLVKKAEEYGYEPNKMGPYSVQLRRDLEELASAGIVHAERLKYWVPDDGDSEDQENLEPDTPIRGTKRVESYRFCLSQDLGLQIGKGLWEKMKEEDREDFEQFKTFFNSLSLRQLLIFTYDKYPEYTGKSTIKRKLGLE